MEKFYIDMWEADELLEHLTGDMQIGRYVDDWMKVVGEECSSKYDIVYYTLRTILGRVILFAWLNGSIPSVP